MPANKKPRKKYRPRPILLDAAAWVVEGGKLANEARVGNLTTVRIKNSDAMLRLMRGDADRDTMDILTHALNVGTGLRVTAGIGAEWEQEFIDAKAAIAAVCDRGVANGDRFIGTATELNALRSMLEVHDAQLQACTLKQLDAAIVYVSDAIRRGAVAKVATQPK